MFLANSNPVFVVYEIAVLVLVAHLVFLWNYSALVRSRLCVAINPEDANRPGTTLHDVHPPEIARAVRVYDNAAAATFAFLLVAL